MPKRTNLDLDLLRAFVAVADARSFSRAASALLRNQSTISLQIQRLENIFGHRLLDRTPRRVKLTADGDTMLAYAQRLLNLNVEVMAQLNAPNMEGIVRLGTPEDFATSRLSKVLSSFAHTYPAVALEVVCDLTLRLEQAFHQHTFDLVLIKREQRSSAQGIPVWREPLVWVASDDGFALDQRPMPLVLSPAPCVYRKRATEALDAAGINWRIAYTCSSMAGSLAAVHAGLGVTVLPKEMAPPGLRMIDNDPLPALDDTEIALLSDEPLSAPAKRLRDHIIRSLEHHDLPSV
jgi:DNA-binding transcriptional LysR family regulator